MIDRGILEARAVQSRRLIGLRDTVVRLEDILASDNDFRELVLRVASSSAQLFVILVVIDLSELLHLSWVLRLQLAWRARSFRDILDHLLLWNRIDFLKSVFIYRNVLECDMSTALCIHHIIWGKPICVNQDLIISCLVDIGLLGFIEHLWFELGLFSVHGL